jgi:amino acid transporter
LDSQLIKVLLIATITGVNLVGVRAGGRLNDILILGKLMLLALLIVLGLALSLLHPALAASHLLPQEAVPDLPDKNPRGSSWKGCPFPELWELP